MMKKRRWVSALTSRSGLISLSILVCCSLAIVLAMRPPAIENPKPSTALLEPLNSPLHGAANLLSIQPHLDVADYAQAGLLQRKLSGYLDQARSAGWLSPQTVVVFPEHIGTWLVAEGESALVFAADTTTGALAWAALGNLSGFLYRLVGAEEQDPFAASLFRTKSEAMADQYQQIFSGLASEYGVTVVAGSILLPEPAVKDERLVVGLGPLYNSSFVFFADGRVAGPVRKVYPIDSELPFTEPAPLDDSLPIVETPAGRLGVLICADSWYPDTWAQIQSAQLVAVPSFSSPDGIWESPWGGYNGARAPDDVADSDVQKLTEAEAWRKYALGGRGRQLRAGINTFLRGDLWDLGDDGQTMAVLDGELILGQRKDIAIVSSLWLNTHHEEVSARD
ncbi:Carbon-nitrogen hydrolase [Microbulbifer aggregans]|uniref:Carbon-nitrogen hydrolase n=1 Tax=Microbulbifer aggregans TaxID=1769779 RepID=A0A1C9W8E8_9GAMM|nr:carbon-nitrogen hydrolase family protein [Microbulbifer aggregans]AOS97429.1 Carbon-nitrogen hydrolase [Microbulbifer aggregans]